MLFLPSPQLLAAVNVKQLDLAHMGAGLVHLADDVAAGHGLVGYQGQVAG